MRVTKQLVERIAFRAALPLLVPQGLWVKATAPRFAPAVGPREGSVGDGEPCRLLAIGDSIVAGVGVERLENAMPGQLARALALHTGSRVDWMACGASGIGARDVRRRLVARLPAGDFDYVFLSVGVNDVTALRSTRHWRRELVGLVEDLRRNSPRASLVVSGLPPLHGFPLLPQPLRAIMGMRARTFDRIAKAETGGLRGVVFVPNRFAPDPAFFAPDGYHPSEESCRVWAETVVEAIEGA
jgi:lysophospholipase L1-like esterase